MNVEGADRKQRPLRYGDIAILFRSTRPMRFFEKELADQGIPYYTDKGHGFYEKQEILDLVNFLKLVENPIHGDLSLAAVLRSPFVNLSDEGLYWFARLAKKNKSQTPLYVAFERLDEEKNFSKQDKAKLKIFHELLSRVRNQKNGLSVPEILQWVLEKTQYETKILARPAGRQALANVHKLLEIARSLEEKGIYGIDDFINYVRSLSERETVEAEASIQGEGSDAVMLSTIHSAKGLEFPFLVIADLGAKLSRPIMDVFYFKIMFNGLKNFILMNFIRQNVLFLSAKTLLSIH